MAFQIQNRWTLLRYLVFACGSTNMGTRLGKKTPATDYRSSHHSNEDIMEEEELMRPDPTNPGTSTSGNTSKKKSSRILQRLFRGRRNKHGTTSDRFSYPKNRRMKMDPGDWGLEEHSIISSDDNQRSLLRGVVSYRRSSRSKITAHTRTDCKDGTGVHSHHPRAHSSCTSGKTFVPSRCRNRHSKSVLERALQNDCSAPEWQTLLQDFVSYTATHRNRTTGVIPYFKATRFTLDSNKAKLLEQILPYVECFECRPTTYTSEGLRYLLDSLVRYREHETSSPISKSTRRRSSSPQRDNQYHLKELKLLHLPSRLFSKDSQLCQSLTAMLQAGSCGDGWSSVSTTLTAATADDSLSTRRLKVFISLEQAGANPYHVTNSFRCASKTPDDSACFRAIQEAFDTTATTLSSLSEPTDSAINDLVGPVNAGEQVESLELVDFFVPAVDFQRFLANPCNPKNISIRRFRLSGSLRIRQPRQRLEQPSIYFDDALGNARFDFSRSSIKDLAMTGCALAFDCVDNVIHSIASLPNLEHLTCSVWKHVPAMLLRLHYRQQLAPQDYQAEYTYETLDITEGLLKMLERGKIKSISSMTAHVQMPRICPALATNKSLKKMDLTSSAGLTRRANQPCWTVEDEVSLLRVLEGSGNTTLEDVSRISCPRLRYCLALNRCGRRQARDEKHTTLDSFIGLLELVHCSTSATTNSTRLSCVDDPAQSGSQGVAAAGADNEGGATTTSGVDIGLDEDAAKDLTKQQVLYGLLQENPHLWCLGYFYSGLMGGK